MLYAISERSFPRTYDLLQLENMRKVIRALVDTVHSQAHWKTVKPVQQVVALLRGKFEQLSSAFWIRYAVGVPDGC